MTTTISTEPATLLDPTDRFADRHIGPRAADRTAMLDLLGYRSMDTFIDAVIPADIRLGGPLDLPAPLTEPEALARLRELAARNEVFRSCIGMGYCGTVLPTVILRNILRNPGWYTQYTPYQPEISQGRLEALLNFQTLIADLTGLPLAGASMLDEATAAAEAMAMCVGISKHKRMAFFAADDCHPQTIEVVRTRAASMGIDLEVGPVSSVDLKNENLAGVLVQYPTTDGRVECYEKLGVYAHKQGVLIVAACDPLALTLLRPPGEWGADICVGSAQRFGVPMGYGGPHAGFLSTRDEFVRKMPGRLVGVSRDARGNPALRLAVQTREQHIKRDRATSNICTAQVLLAIMAGSYAVYHGPGGLRRIARRVRAHTQTLCAGLLGLGHKINGDLVFDTLRVRPVGVSPKEVVLAARHRKINLRDFGDGSLGITLDETSDRTLIADLLEAFGGKADTDIDALAAQADLDLPAAFARTTEYLTHRVFNTHHSETQMVRYLMELQSRDLSLLNSMIPLGSCTMKLNATTEMEPITWPGFANLHPFAPRQQAVGYFELFAEFERWLGEITGLASVSLMPNAGSQGEYTGLLTIRAYHDANGQADRTVCLIPVSAHGTNPASAVIAGMKVVPIKSTDQGWIDLDDLRAKAEKHAESLGAIMVTYPSTCGVFEPHIRAICQIVHDRGGLVYLDGANMNAQVGLSRPGDYGADVVHLNLHKTFAIPHGGGGPGMGPIACSDQLAPFLPTHPILAPDSAGDRAIGPVSAAPYGSASILPISWAYCAMLGEPGLRLASETAILNANYMAERLRGHYDILFAGPNGRCAHEFIIDCRPFKKTAEVTIDDIAKRLMDYGFHAPTMSWPVAGTLMVEPTESEPRAELDRFCDALIAIRAEIARVEGGDWSRVDNPLKGAPHCVEAIAADDWPHAYTRQTACYPMEHLRTRKFWPPVGRVDNPYGDRNLFCSCPPVG